MPDLRSPAETLCGQNTDRELWREGTNDSTPRIFVTFQGGVGIAVGGRVVVKTLREWHALAEPEPGAACEGSYVVPAEVGPCYDAHGVERPPNPSALLTTWASSRVPEPAELGERSDATTCQGNAHFVGGHIMPFDGGPCLLCAEGGVRPASAPAEPQGTSAAHDHDAWLLTHRTEPAEPSEEGRQVPCARCGGRQTIGGRLCACATSAVARDMTSLNLPSRARPPWRENWPM